MFFTFAVYSIILAVASESTYHSDSTTTPIQSTNHQLQSHSTNYFSTRTTLPENYSTLTKSGNTLSTSTDYGLPTGHSDLELFSRSDETNYRSKFDRSDEIGEDDGLGDSSLGTTESIGTSQANSTSSNAAVYQDEPDDDFTSTHLRPTGTSSTPVYGSLTITSSGLQSANHEICDFCIYEGEGNFTSYGYPLPYRSNLNCSYRVQRTTGEESDYCELDLIFHDFDVPVSSIAGVTSAPGEINNDCTEDYLVVSGRRFCGNGWRGRSEIIPFPANQKEVTFYFVSNERVTGRGFWVEVKKRPGTCYGKKAAMRACEERYSDPEFYITSPQFPSGYPNNADCTYHIRRADQSVCGLELKFLHFDLEPGDGCPFDYLTIDGQRYCGTLSPQTIKQIKFDEDQKVIIFHSDKQVPRSGFHLLVRQIRKCNPSPSLPPPPTCNICTSERSGILVSYSYPNPYRNNLYCTYTLEKADSEQCSVELKFDDFDLVPSPDCSEDYLSFGGSRYCGSTLHSTQRVLEFGSNNTVDMTFRTDGSSNSRGFSASYRQLPCSPPATASPSGPVPVSSSSPSPARDITPLPTTENQPTTTTSPFCDRTFNEMNFLLLSYNYTANYPNNLDCTYTVFKNTSKVCYLELTFLAFDVEASPQCQFDYLEINNVRLCGTLQRETTRTYIFDGPEKPIKFHSDNSSNRGGFLIRAEQLECHGDAIIRNVSAAGDSPSSDLIPDHPIPCDQLISESTFEIISPLYPSPYPRSSDCVYMIQKVHPRVCRLEVTYYDFELQGVNAQRYCSFDYLDFNGIRMCGSVNKGSVRNYYFPDSKFSIRFHADSSLSGRGFRLGVKQGECDPNTVEPALPATSSTPLPSPSISQTLPPPSSVPTQCDKIFTEGFVEITSPAYPANYPPSTQCTYTIVKRNDAGPICQLEVNVIDLELDQTLACQGDYLDFEREIICGSIPPKTVKFFPFERSEFVIRFQSDSLDTVSVRRGFLLQIRQRECQPSEAGYTSPSAVKSPTTSPTSNDVSQLPIPDKKRLDYCGQTFRVHKFELKSPHFPASYESDLDCPYIIKRVNPNICFLDLFFLDFELQDDRDCLSDYLSISGKKYCGLIKPGAIQTYPFGNRSEIAIIFHTDGSNAGRGFYIRGAQRECDPLTSQTHESRPNATLTSGHSAVTISSAAAAAASICEFCFASRDGEIKSYNHPDFYPSNLNCNYRITGLPNHCAVYLKFDIFDLEEPRNSHCLGDYLEIGGERFCGNQLSQFQKLLDFHGKPREVVLRFHTNEIISGKGFKISYAQIPCTNIGINQIPITTSSAQSVSATDKQIPQLIADSVPISVIESNDKLSIASSGHHNRVPCDLVVFDNRFEISTPGYPYAYPNSADCLFSIRRANYNVCKLKLEFIDFDIETSTNCGHDHLDIEGERLCGIIANNTIREYDFHNYKLALRFRSDDSGSRRGFFIKGQQIECYETIKSSSPPYPSNSADFPSYSPFDSSFNPIKQQYHGSSLASSSPSFSSSSSINYPSSFGSLPHSVHQSYPSNYPAPPLPSITNLYPPSPSQQARQSPAPSVTGSINVADNSDHHGSSNRQDHYNGHNDNHHGNQDSFQQFNSHVSTTCDRTISETFFDVQSSNYPQRYPPGSKCSIIIKKANPSVCKLDLMFINFDVGSRSCSSDYLSIDGERLCGVIESGTVKTFSFDLPEKFIFFRGDLSQGLGFNIRGRQVECSSGSVSSSTPSSIIARSSISLKSPASRLTDSLTNPLLPFPGSPVISNGQSPLSHIPYCDQIFTETDFTILSPNHPSSYPSNLYCRFTIHRPSSSFCAIDIHFVNFDVEESSGCLKDYLEIDGSKICGLLPPHHQRRYNYFNDKETSKTIIFRSDSAGSKSGFSLKISHVTGCRSYSDSASSHVNSYGSSKSQCNECMKDLVGQITSDNYPNQYGNGVDCNYRIASAGPQYCKVTVYIRDMDIEESEACDRDYLFVEGQRLCNTNYKPKPMTIYFPEFGPKEITFSFHTDSKGTGRGFFLDYMQHSCATISPSLSPSSMSKSPFYPSNHVSKAVIEEIVETKVTVLDQRPPAARSPASPAVSARVTATASHLDQQRSDQHHLEPNSEIAQRSNDPQQTFHSVSAKDSIFVGDPSSAAKKSA